MSAFSPSPPKKAPQPTICPIKLSSPLKEARREAIMLTQQEISFRRNQTQIGKVVDVLIEQENPSTGELIGRSDRFAPDVDGLVYVKGQAPLGQLIPVLIEAADAYDLFGSIAVPAAVPAVVTKTLA